MLVEKLSCFCGIDLNLIFHFNFLNFNFLNRLKEPLMAINWFSEIRSLDEFQIFNHGRLHVDCIENLNFDQTKQSKVYLVTSSNQ